ncbi:MAG: hypothetical protein R2865_10500 [Deinococcales bacterium]
MARRVSYGVCKLCGQRVAKSAMTRHLDKCVVQHEATGKAVKLYRLRIDGYSQYWPDVEMKVGVSSSNSTNSFAAFGLNAVVT